MIFDAPSLLPVARKCFSIRYSTVLVTKTNYPIMFECDRFNLRESSIDFKYRSARAGSFGNYNALAKEKESFA